MIYDCNVLYGVDIACKGVYETERILSLMNSKSIDKALIINIKCKFYDFAEGNNETIAVVRQYGGKLSGMIGFNPSQYINVEKEIERCIDIPEMACIRVFNTGYNFTAGWGGGIGSLTMKRVYALAERRCYPVFIEGGYPFEAVAAVAEKYPKVPFIVSGVGYGNMGEAILAVKETRNVYLEISGLDSMGGVEILTKHAGAHRLVFGTGMPVNSPSCELNMVRMARISETEKDKILSGNLIELLGRKGI